MAIDESWPAVAQEAYADGSPHLHAPERLVPQRGGNTTDDERQPPANPSPELRLRLLQPVRHAHLAVLDALLKPAGACFRRVAARAVCYRSNYRDDSSAPDLCPETWAQDLNISGTQKTTQTPTFSHAIERRVQSVTLFGDQVIDPPPTHAEEKAGGVDRVPGAVSMRKRYGLVNPANRSPL